MPVFETLEEALVYGKHIPAPDVLLRTFPETEPRTCFTKLAGAPPIHGFLESAILAAVSKKTWVLTPEALGLVVLQFLVKDSTEPVRAWSMDKLANLTNQFIYRNVKKGARDGLPKRSWMHDGSPFEKRTKGFKRSSWPVAMLAFPSSEFAFQRAWETNVRSHANATDFAVEDGVSYTLDSVRYESDTANHEWERFGEWFARIFPEEGSRARHVQTIISAAMADEPTHVPTLVVQRNEGHWMISGLIAAFFQNEPCDLDNLDSGMLQVAVHVREDPRFYMVCSGFLATQSSLHEVRPFMGWFVIASDVNPYPNTGSIPDKLVDRRNDVPLEKRNLVQSALMNLGMDNVGVLRRYAVVEGAFVFGYLNQCLGREKEIDGRVYEFYSALVGHPDMIPRSKWGLAEIQDGKTVIMDGYTRDYMTGFTMMPVYIRDDDTNSGMLSIVLFPTKGISLEDLSKRQGKSAAQARHIIEGFVKVLVEKKK